MRSKRLRQKDPKVGNHQKRASKGVRASGAALYEDKERDYVRSRKSWKVFGRRRSLVARHCPTTSNHPHLHKARAHHKWKCLGGLCLQRRWGLGGALRGPIARIRTAIESKKQAGSLGTHISTVAGYRKVLTSELCRFVPCLSYFARVSVLRQICFVFFCLLGTETMA